VLSEVKNISAKQLRVENRAALPVMFLGDKLMKTSVFTPLVLVVCAFALVACANTVRGVGKDVKDTGRAVQQTIE